MKELKHLYAEDEQGDIVHINTATKGGTYYNLARGKDEQKIPMIVRDGGNRHKHFAIHPDCEIKDHKAFYDQYIHTLWKKRIKEQFDSSDHFHIKLNMYKREEKKIQLQTIDLKERYDTCEEEKGYKGYMDDKEYIGDLKLTHSQHPEREPVFIEVFFTHECSEEKKVSGIKIIEVKVESDEDITLSYTETRSADLVKNILNHNTMNPYGVKDIPNTRFYGFPRELQPAVGRFSVMKEDGEILKGKYSVLNDYWQEAELTHDKNSLMDITLPADIVAKQPDEYMKAFYATALKNRIPIGHCMICFHNIIKPCPYRREGEGVCDKKYYRVFDIGRFSKLLYHKEHKIWINQELLSSVPIKVRMSWER